MGEKDMGEKEECGAAMAVGVFILPEPA